MIPITTYDDDGRILLSTACTEDTIDIVGQPHYVDGSHDGETKYVLNGEVVDRPPNPTLITGTTLYNIPMPAQLRISDGAVSEYVDVTDSTVELVLPVVGGYNVTVLSHPYLNERFLIEVP